eukprot:248803-Alexandrium_andersonii.AAC.1
MPQPTIPGPHAGASCVPSLGAALAKDANRAMVEGLDHASSISTAAVAHLATRTCWQCAPTRPRSGPHAGRRRY